MFAVRIKMLLLIINSLIYCAVKVFMLLLIFHCQSSAVAWMNNVEWRHAA